MTDIQELLKPLDGLYGKTGDDWCIRIYNIITEPTAWTCVIWPEEDKEKHILRWGDTAEESVGACVKAVLESLKANEQTDD